MNKDALVAGGMRMCVKYHMVVIDPYYIETRTHMEMRMSVRVLMYAYVCVCACLCMRVHVYLQEKPFNKR